MFDLSNKPILFAFAALTSAVIGACFNGNDADGLPCSDKSQCGPGSECIDGYCAGVFLCADGSLVDAGDVCNAEPDCDDESDEDPGLCGGGGANINQCEEANGDLSYRIGGSAAGSSNAIKVAAIDIMGSPKPDAISAGVNGDHVRIEFDLETSQPKEYFLGSPPPSFGDRTVFDFQTGDVNGDMKQDVLIMTIGSSVVAYIYQNMSPNPPELYGSEIEVDEMLGVTLHGIELGRLNNDSSVDVVGVVDIGPIHGVLLVSLGDSSAANSGEAYFTPQLIEGSPLGYDMFIDSTVADIDGDGLDDLLVVGARNGSGPALWFVRRSGDGDVLNWDAPIVQPLMSPGTLAVGYITDAPQPGQPLGPMPDVAILDAMNGRISTLLNTNGSLQPGLATTIEGAGFGGLTFADMNCDGQGDFVYNLIDPPEVRVLFGDGLGGVMSDVPLAFVDEGSPRGGLGVALFDEDSTPDIFSSADPGTGQMDSQVRVLVTGAE